MASFSQSEIDALGARAETMVKTLGAISAEPDRLVWLFLTPEHRRAADRIADWMRGAGLSVSEDALGTVRGRREGPDKRLLIGSHIDTVIDAGTYDGPFGVIAGILAVDHLRDRGFRTLAFCGFAGAPYSERRQRYFEEALTAAALPIHIYEETLKRDAAALPTMAIEAAAPPVWCSALLTAASNPALHAALSIAASAMTIIGRRQVRNANRIKFMPPTFPSVGVQRQPEWWPATRTNSVPAHARAVREKYFHASRSPPSPSRLFLPASPRSNRLHMKRRADAPPSARPLRHLRRAAICDVATGGDARPKV